MSSNIYYIRSFLPTDLPFVKVTFLKGLYLGDSWFSVMPKRLFFNNYAPIVEALITKNVVQVACLTEDPDTIVGYSIISPDLETLHWAYVKKPWRGNGIGRVLMPASATTFTHLTKLGKALLDKRNAVFNPFAV